MKILLILMAISYAFSAFAETDRSILTEKMKEGLKPFIKSAQQDYFFYNYRPRSDFNLGKDYQVKLFDPYLLSKYQDWQETFYRYTPEEGGFLGWGLYGALEPVVSRKYAKDDWILLETVIPQGSTILDIRKYSDSCFPIKKDLYQELSKNCSALKNISSFCPKEKDGFIFTNKLELTNDLFCHEVFSGAIREMGVELIVYNWSTVTSLHPQCKANKKFPGLFATNLRLKKNNTKFYSSSLPIDSDKETIYFYNRLYQFILEGLPKDQDYLLEFFTPQTTSFFEQMFIDIKEYQINCEI